MNAFTRGSAPGRARNALERPGSFKRGHQKLGGRKKGTPNIISANYKSAVIAAAVRVGMAGMGEGGAVGYFRYLAREYPVAYCNLLCKLLDFEVDACTEGPSVAPDQLDADLRKSFRVDNQQSADSLVDELTMVAIKDPGAFCKALAALIPRAPRRRLHSRECF